MWFCMAGAATSGGGVKGSHYTGAPEVSEENGALTDHAVGILTGLTTVVTHVVGHLFVETCETAVLGAAKDRALGCTDFCHIFHHW